MRELPLELLDEGGKEVHEEMATIGRVADAAQVRLCPKQVKQHHDAVRADAARVRVVEGE